MITGLDKISEIAENKQDYKLQTLIHVINKENLIESHKELDGTKARGVDKITKEQYSQNLEENIERLLEDMKQQRYKPQPSRRVYIPKIGTNKMRPLGIPSYEDKIVQNIVSEILNSIYEPMFYDCSYGFRPKRSCHDTIKELNRTIITKKISYIVDADIKGFFDNVNHEWLNKFLRHRIQDKNFLRLINRFLKAGIMEECKVYETDRGTPQGGIISPILANIYLHYVLDMWFEKIVKKQCKGEAYITRYADDFVCCFQFWEDAKIFYDNLKERLSKFGLELSEEKSRIIKFGRYAKQDCEIAGKRKPDKFDFLGFTFICGVSRNNKFQVILKTSQKKYTAKLKVAKEWLKDNMHEPIKTIIEKLNIKLIGHYRYYGVNTNYDKINKFRYDVLMQLFRTINRRSQKRSCTNKTFFNRVVKLYPIVNPKIYVKLYETA